MKTTEAYRLARLVVSAATLLLAVALAQRLPDIATIIALAAIWMKISI